MRRRTGRSLIGDDNFLTGVLFIAIGGFAAIHGSTYGLGSMKRFEAGTFPVIVGVLLCLVGLGLTIKAIRRAKAEGVHALQLRSLACITAAIIFGGAALQWAGLVVAIPGTVLLASLAATGFRPLPIILMALFLTLFAYLVFFLGLGIQLPLYPGAV